MKLAGFGIYRYGLPLAEPIVLKGATLRSREGLLVRFTGDEGREGWGEAAPLPGFSREGLGEVEVSLRETGKSLVGCAVSRMDPDANLYPDLPVLPPSARFALELAARNLLPETMRRRATETVWLNGLLQGPAAKILAEARRMRDAGYRAVKLKVGRRAVGEEAELVRALGGLLGDGVSLRLDANRAWGFGEAVAFARAVRDVRVEYVEEPLADAALLPRFADDTDLPVALDESLVRMEPEDLEDHRYASAVVLKPTLLGGISRTLRMAEVANRLGIAPVVSSAYEGGVGTLGLISLAATIGEAPAGLDTYRRLAEDVLRPPLDLDAPHLDVRAALETRREVALDGLKLVADL